MCLLLWKEKDPFIRDCTEPCHQYQAAAAVADLAVKQPTGLKSLSWDHVPDGS